MERWKLWCALGAGVLTLACAGVGKDKDTETVVDDGTQDDDSDGYAAAEDCNDSNASIHPGAQETCDPADVDEDCDGLSDSADSDASGTVVAYHDSDLDGYGDPAGAVYVCELTAGYSSLSTDCDDANPSANPGVTEICDDGNTDEDCDGLADDADSGVSTGTYTTWYRDADGDTYGHTPESEQACDAPPGYVGVDGDCDDGRAAVYPGGVETWYDGIDGDCSGTSDYDQDEDGWDSDEHGGYDCDDRAYAVYPGADDIPYDGVDADCSGDTDYDVDGDGHDAEAYGGDDCDDDDATTYYGAYEAGTSDNNCDGVVLATPEALADYDTRASSLYVCETLYLDGTGSRDPSGGALTYAWELDSTPSGATETTDDIVEADDPAPTFVPMTAGTYMFSLVVTNTRGTSSYTDYLPVDITERPTNDVPVADAGRDVTDEQTVSCTTTGYTETCDACSDATFTLDASGSVDTDGDALTYTWTVTSGTATLSSDTGETTVLTIPGSTTLDGSTTTSTVVVSLTATDCYGGTSTSTVTLVEECTGT